MTTFERIKKLADKRKISLQKVATDLGFSENYIYNLKYKKSPSVKHLSAIADYFKVSLNYLIGTEEIKVVKEPVDLAELIDDDDVEWDKWVSFDGKPISDEDKLIIKRVLGSRKK